jgi:hypothetical protein
VRIAASPRSGGSVTRKGKVEGHRSLDLHVWHLVAKALASMGYGPGAPPDPELFAEIVANANAAATLGSAP